MKRAWSCIAAAGVVGASLACCLDSVDQRAPGTNGVGGVGDAAVAEDAGAYSTITEFSAFIEDPLSIVTGPDGNLWFTEGNPNLIGRMTIAGGTDLFSVPTPTAVPFGICAGPDGNVWFSEFGSGKIGVITPTGDIQEFATPYPTQPAGLALGPDGNVWFADSAPTSSLIGEITSAGVVTGYAIARGAPRGADVVDGFPSDSVATGSDGAVWFTSSTGNVVGRLYLDGGTGLTALPTASSGPMKIVLGPDGSMWFTEIGGPRLGYVDPRGLISEYPLLAPTRVSNDIVVGPDGALWFTEPSSTDTNWIGRITTSGVITEFAVPTPASEVNGITIGPDKNVWFTEAAANKIGRLSLGPMP